jgi:hypothetical protein
MIVVVVYLLGDLTLFPAFIENLMPSRNSHRRSWALALVGLRRWPADACSARPVPSNMEPDISQVAQASEEADDRNGSPTILLLIDASSLVG